MHSEAVLKPVEVPSVPAGHAVHAMSAEPCPCDSQKPPSWHRSQLVLPCNSLKVPTPQGSHVALRGLAANWPGEQEMQAAPVSCPEAPAGQSAQRGVVHVDGSEGARTMEEL